MQLILFSLAKCFLHFKKSNKELSIPKLLQFVRYDWFLSIWNLKHFAEAKKKYPCFMSPDQKIRVSRSEIFFIFKSQNMCVIMREMVSFLTWSRVHLSVMFCFSVYIHRCLLGDYDDCSLISLQAWLTHTVSSTDDEVLVP